jgi:hypothetical protein
MLSKTFAKNVFTLPADFERFRTMILTPHPRSIDL